MKFNSLKKEKRPAKYFRTVFFYFFLVVKYQVYVEFIFYGQKFILKSNLQYFYFRPIKQEMCMCVGCIMVEFKKESLSSNISTLWLVESVGKKR